MVRLFNIGEPDPIKPESDIKSASPSQLPTLPIGTEINGYIIKSVRAIGGFGITYRAVEAESGANIALKEYFPTLAAVRDDDGSVIITSEKEEKYFRRGMQSFWDEGETLARFDHPSIVKVHRLFVAHGTAYMVMDLIGGPTLRDLLDEGTYPKTQTQLDRFLRSLLSAVELIHRQAFIHRDIHPRNIILRAYDGTPMMIDFGARYERLDDDADTNLGVLVTVGYAPPEQYSTSGRQNGPWTDIYAISATLREIILGDRPSASVERLIIDGMLPLKTMTLQSQYRSDFLKAIDWGLAPLPKDRPQSIAEWRSTLFAGAPAETEHQPVPIRPRPTKIFISYRRSDARHIAGRMYDRLAQEFGDDEIFFDVDSIPVGVDFRSHITGSLKDSAVVLAIVGPAWVNKQWSAKRSFFSPGRPPEDFVETEIALAIASGVPVIPVLVDNVAMPPAVALPSALKSFVYLNGSPVRAGRDFKSDMDRVVAAIREQRGDPTPAASDTKT